jgi:hypothetical protein
MKHCARCEKEIDGLSTCCGVGYIDHTQKGVAINPRVRLAIDTEHEKDSADICNACAVEILETATAHLKDMIRKGR